MGTAITQMRRAHIRHLLVVDADRLVGIVSHRDWSRIPMGAAARGWEKQLDESGWSILRRDFTEHCRSVFHLLKAQ